MFSILVLKDISNFLSWEMEACLGPGENLAIHFKQYSLLPSKY